MKTTILIWDQFFNVYICQKEGNWHFIVSFQRKGKMFVSKLSASHFFVFISLYFQHREISRDALLEFIKSTEDMSICLRW